MKPTEYETLDAQNAYDYIHYFWKDGVDPYKERAPREFPVFEGYIDEYIIEALDKRVALICAYAEKMCKGRRHTGFRNLVEEDVRIIRGLKVKSWTNKDCQAYVQELHTWIVTLGCELKLN